MIQVRSATPLDKADWLRMRHALWPDKSGDHAAEIERYFAGQLNMPLEVLLALDEQGRAIGFADSVIGVL